MRYLVIEIQTNAQGTTSYLVYTYTERSLADQKYYLVLSSAAVSQIPVHTVVLLTNTGDTLEKRMYTHTMEPNNAET